MHLCPQESPEYYIEHYHYHHHRHQIRVWLESDAFTTLKVPLKDTGFVVMSSLP